MKLPDILLQTSIHGYIFHSDIKGVLSFSKIGGKNVVMHTTVQLLKNFLHMHTESASLNSGGRLKHKAV